MLGVSTVETQLFSKKYQSAVFYASNYCEVSTETFMPFILIIVLRASTLKINFSSNSWMQLGLEFERRKGGH